MSDEPRLMPHHLTELHICRRGARHMANLQGWDWNEFLKNGIPLSKMEAVDDTTVKKIIKHVRGE